MSIPKGSHRIIRFGIPLTLMTVALAADHIGLDRQESGFGKTETAVLVLSAIFFVVGFGDKKGSWTTNLLLVTGATYLTLLICEAIISITYPSREDVNPRIALKGLYISDDEIGFKLAPNWSGFWNDGIVKAEYRTNSKGHRDDEPNPDPTDGLLLIGDSFTFGSLLDQHETIDKQIEELAGGEVSAYNLGVPAVGPPMILEYLRRADWFKGSNVVYLFFNNDLRDDNLVANVNTVLDGFLVQQFDPATGRRFTQDELKAKIANRLEDHRTNPIRDTLKLLQLRQLLKSALLSPETDPLFSGNESTDFHEQNIHRALSITEEMRSVAQDRGMGFYVAIIPSKGEAAAGRYSTPTAAFHREINQEGFNVIEILESVTSDHYFPHDGHFNQLGAKEAARAIVEQLQWHSVQRP